MNEGPPSALGSKIASGRPATIASRSASVSPVSRPFTRTSRRGRLAAGARTFGRARFRLAVGGDRILQVEDQRVGAALQALGKFSRAVTRHKQKRTHGKNYA